MKPSGLKLPGPVATEAFGRALGARLRPGDVVGLIGPLGAGKTTLVRAIVAGAGADPGQVTSPTFSLINTYRGPRFPLHHADLYRLESRDELYATGYDDLLDGEGAVIVEWIDRIAAAAPGDWLEVQLAMVPGAPDAREVTLVPHGARAMALAGTANP